MTKHTREESVTQRGEAIAYQAMEAAAGNSAMAAEYLVEALIQLAIHHDEPHKVLACMIEDLHNVDAKARRAQLLARAPAIYADSAYDDFRRLLSSDELHRRITSNKDWLSKNWTLGKDVRKCCEEVIAKDEGELARRAAAPEGRKP